MGFKPGDFFIGVVDFFGIVVPGAVLLFLHKETIVTPLGYQFGQDKTGLWVASFLGSYVLGHFLLGIGVPLNQLLGLWPRESEDGFYNKVKALTILPPGVKEDRTNVFYRAYAFVRLENPSALAEIERQMADYKLFRSLTLVFAFDLLIMGFRGVPYWPRLVLSGTLFLLAAWRFLFLLGWTYRITFEYYDLLHDRSKRSAEGAQSA